MKIIRKRFISMALALTMLFACCFTAFAAEPTAEDVNNDNSTIVLDNPQDTYTITPLAEGDSVVEVLPWQGYQTTTQEFTKDFKIGWFKSGYLYFWMQATQASVVHIKVTKSNGDVVCSKSVNFPKGNSVWKLTDKIGSGTYHVSFLYMTAGIDVRTSMAVLE